MGGGEDAKVSHAHADACKGSMQPLINLIEDFENNRLRAATSFGKDRCCALGTGIRANEVEETLRGILSITVHYRYGIVPGSLLNIHQANGDCSLMAQVPAQAQEPDCSNHGVVELEVFSIALLDRAIVNQQDLDQTRVVTEGFVNPAN
jgi:hypothetical protein